jgi:hypothetical protein
MILDTATLRVAFAAMALILALLFYFSTFRSTRSPYSAWWCAALLLFLSGSASFLLNGTPQQVWANPLGNFLLVSGAAGVWGRGAFPSEPEVQPVDIRCAAGHRRRRRRRRQPGIQYVGGRCRLPGVHGHAYRLGFARAVAA